MSWWATGHQLEPLWLLNVSSAPTAGGQLVDLSVLRSSACQLGVSAFSNAVDFIQALVVNDRPGSSEPPIYPFWPGGGKPLGSTLSFAKCQEEGKPEGRDPTIPTDHCHLAPCAGAGILVV